MELIKIGTLKPKHAREWMEFRLGIGFETLDRYAFDTNPVLSRWGNLN